MVKVFEEMIEKVKATASGIGVGEIIPEPEYWKCILIAVP